MKKIKYCHFYLVVSFIFMAAHLHSSVINGGFEKGDAGWHLGKGWNISQEEPYKGKQCAMIECDSSKKYVGIDQKMAIIKNTYYKLTLYYKTTFKNLKDNKKYVSFELQFDKDHFRKYKSPCCKKWNKVIYYFFSGINQNITLKVYIEEDSKLGALCLDEVQLTKLTNNNLKNIQIPNGNFELGDKLPVNWKDYFGRKNYNTVMELDQKANFIKGKKSLKLTTIACDDVNTARIMILGTVPIVPGKKYVLELWLKGEKQDTVAAYLVEGNFFGKYWNKVKKIKTDTSWRKYNFEFSVPDDPKSNRLINIRVGLSKTVSTLWIDDMKLYIKESQ